MIELNMQSPSDSMAPTPHPLLVLHSTHWTGSRLARTRILHAKTCLMSHSDCNSLATTTDKINFLSHSLSKKHDVAAPIITSRAINGKHCAECDRDRSRIY